jgi:hypothetical protein
MANDERLRFDLVGTARRLEDWFLENVAFPVGQGLQHWPGGRSDAISFVLMDHWTYHVEWHWVQDERRKRRPSVDADRRALGVALALLEIGAYEVTARENEEVEWLRESQGIRSIRPSTREKLRALAEQIVALPLSRVFRTGTRTRGRPKLLLANAIAQHLLAGGFSSGKIATFMGSTEGAVRWWCRAADTRSFANFFGPCP